MYPAHDADDGVQELSRKVRGVGAHWDQAVHFALEDRTETRDLAVLKILEAASPAQLAELPGPGSLVVMTAIQATQGLHDLLTDNFLAQFGSGAH